MARRWATGWIASGGGIRRGVTVALLTIVATTALLVLAPAGPAAGQDGTATIEIVNREAENQPDWDKPVLIYPATADGRRGERPIYDGTVATISIEPGCWVVASPNLPFSPIFLAFDRSRPYIDPPGTTVPYQMHFVCLEAGETYVFDNEISSGLGGRRPSLNYIVVGPDGEPLDGVTVTVRDDTGEVSTRELGPDGRGGESVFARSFEFVSIEHPDHTFESELLGRPVGGLDQGWVTFVGTPRGQDANPAGLTVDLASTPAADDVQVEVQIAREGDGAFTYRHRTYDGPGSVGAPLGAGCYEVQLFAYRGEVLFAEVDRAIRRFQVCLGPGEQRTITSGDLALANVSGDNPFLPIDVEDESGAPVPGVNATFFYPRADLTPDDLRTFDHRSADARGVFYRGTVTGSDGRALMPNYTECLVATLQAPDGYAFATGEWWQQTVCEGESVAVTAAGGGGPPPDPTTSLGGRVRDRAQSPVEGVVVDLFTSDRSAARIEYLRSAATDGRGEFLFALDAGGCYVVTLIAPPGTLFRNGTKWLNQHRCLDDGEQLADIVVGLVPEAPDLAQLSALVFDGPTRDVEVDGVAVDLFVANGDGSRGRWIEQVTTGPGVEFEVDAGCYVLTFIGPDGRTFLDTGTMWANRPTCVPAGGRAELVANLAPGPLSS